jgi:hypothetical protein
MTDQSFTHRRAPLAGAVLAALAVFSPAASGQVLPAPTAGLELAVTVDPEALRPIPEDLRRASAFMDALERAAEGSDDPPRTRGTLLARFRAGNACYSGDLPPDALDAMIRSTLLLPPTQSRFAARYFSDNTVWVNDADQGPTGTSRAARLTYSFPSDGVAWGLSCAGIGTGPNDLNAKLTSTWTHLDRGREYIRTALASWRRFANLTYTEVPDDDSPCDSSSARVATRGDIRIGGTPLGTTGTLAYNGFPSSAGSFGCGGGDMTINTSYFPGSFANVSYFRNTVAHEHGHGLGFMHSVPCNKKKLMEPFIVLDFDALQSDEVRGAMRNYGDRYAGNHTPAFARSLGNLSSPGRSVIEKDLGLNGPSVNIPGVGFVAQDDWFVFSLSAPQYVKITAAPTGVAVPTSGACCASGGCVIVSSASLCSGAFAGVGTPCTPSPCATPSVVCCTPGTGACTLVAGNLCPSGQTQTGAFSCSPSPCTGGSVCQGGSTDPEYCQARQLSSCSAQGSIAAVDSTRAGLLGLELRTPSNLNTGQSPFAGSTTAVLGMAQEIEFASLPAGTYYVRVWDQGGAPSSNQTVQTYDLTVRVGSSSASTFKAPPVAIAGLQSKRCRAGIPCYFMGQFNSYATEPGATIAAPSGYAWDLDGDGAFETTGPQVSLTYTSNGTYPVTLRVTDSNGQSATDTMQVTIFGATTSVSSISPNSGSAGTTVPVVINGANFKGVTSASQVTISGTGVTVTGTPAVNALGTQITGLSFVVAPGAAAGLRNITVTNSDGLGASGTNNNRFSVTAAAATGACCAADGSCAAVASASCTGDYQGDGTACSPNPCPQPTGACCSAAGACTSVTQAACAGTFQGPGTACVPSPCPPPTGACCVAGGSCSSSTQSACAGAWTLGAACSPNPCPQPTGACCSPGGNCSVTTQANCSGSFQGTGSGCSPSPCAGPCCRGSTCAVLPAAQCVAGGNAGALSLSGASCNAAGSDTIPCCKADYNKQGGVELLDVFAFLTDWFNASPWTDFDGAGGVDILDIFAFLTAWFNGC